MTRTKMRNLIETSWFQRTIVGLILANSVLIGLETSPEYMNAFGTYIDQIDRIILFVFVLEILLKLYAYGWDFFKSPWNLFDSILAVSAVIGIASKLGVPGGCTTAVVVRPAQTSWISILL